MTIIIKLPSSSEGTLIKKVKKYNYFKIRVILKSNIYNFIILSEEENVLFNDALNTFYLRLYGIKDMVKDHLYSERGNLLLPHRLLLLINSKGYFICIIPQTG